MDYQQYCELQQQQLRSAQLQTQHQLQQPEQQEQGQAQAQGQAQEVQEGGLLSATQQGQSQALPQAQTPALDFVAPPPPSPWDAPRGTPLGTPVQVCEDAQFLEAMAAAFGLSRRDAQSLIPPITTLEMAEAHHASANNTSGEVPTPTSTTSMSAATPASTIGDMATPFATPTELEKGETMHESQAQTQMQIQTQMQAQQYQPPQVIQLVERPPRRPRAQARQQSAQGQVKAQGQRKERLQVVLQSSSSTSPVEQNQAQSQAQFVTTAPSPTQWYDMHALAASHSRVGVGAGAVSSAGSKANNNVSKLQKARQAAHPYANPRQNQRRTVSGPAAVGTVAQSDMAAPGHVSSPSASVPSQSPVSTTRSTLNVPTSTSPQARVPRYLVRTDVHYDILSNTLTAMLELPGVPRAAVRIALGDDIRSGTKMLIVRGRMRRVTFPLLNKDRNKTVDGAEGSEDNGYVVKERKCGEFKRVLVVPTETKPEDIRVSMQDGILFLRYPAGEQDILLASSSQKQEQAHNIQPSTPAGSAHSGSGSGTPTPNSTMTQGSTKQVTFQSSTLHSEVGSSSASTQNSRPVVKGHIQTYSPTRGPDAS